MPCITHKFEFSLYVCSLIPLTCIMAVQRAVRAIWRAKHHLATLFLVHFAAGQPRGMPVSIQ